MQLILPPLVSRLISTTQPTRSTWKEIYEGTLPCADCEGIRTTLNLNKDASFTLKEEYLGKKSPAAFNSKGKWVVNENTITLQFDKELQDRRVQYKAGENKLWLLDQEGKEITGTLAGKYIMTKK